MGHVSLKPHWAPQHGIINSLLKGQPEEAETETRQLHLCGLKSCFLKRVFARSCLMVIHKDTDLEDSGWMRSSEAVLIRAAENKDNHIQSQNHFRDERASHGRVVLAKAKHTLCAETQLPIHISCLLLPPQGP